jgi:hypothetical protein
VRFKLFRYKQHFPFKFSIQINSAASLCVLCRCTGLSVIFVVIEDDIQNFKRVLCSRLFLKLKRGKRGLGVVMFKNMHGLLAEFGVLYPSAHTARSCHDPFVAFYAKHVACLPKYHWSCSKRLLEWSCWCELLLSGWVTSDKYPQGI